MLVFGGGPLRARGAEGGCRAPSCSAPGAVRSRGAGGQSPFSVFSGDIASFPARILMQSARLTSAEQSNYQVNINNPAPHWRAG